MDGRSLVRGFELGFGGVVRVGGGSSEEACARSSSSLKPRGCVWIA